MKKTLVHLETNMIYFWVSYLPQILFQKDDWKILETVVQLINQNAIAKHHVQIEVDAEEHYKIKDAKTDSVKGTDDFGCI